MINFNKLKLTEGMDPIEQSASDKSVESAEKKRDPRTTVRQKNQMAQTPQSKTKSNVVYASEEKEQTPNHPYVNMMPMMDTAEKQAKEQMKMAKEVGVKNANKLATEEKNPLPRAKMMKKLGKLQMDLNKDGMRGKAKENMKRREKIQAAMDEDFDFMSELDKLVEQEVKKNPYRSPFRPHGPKTKEEAKAQKEADKKLFDRKYFDSARD